jgi:hypothetical protein
MENTNPSTVSTGYKGKGKATQTIENIPHDGYPDESARNDSVTPSGTATSLAVPNNLPSSHPDGSVIPTQDEIVPCGIQPKLLSGTIPFPDLKPDTEVYSTQDDTSIPPSILVTHTSVDQNTPSTHVKPEPANAQSPEWIQPPPIGPANNPETQETSQVESSTPVVTENQNNHAANSVVIDTRTTPQKMEDWVRKSMGMRQIPRINILSNPLTGQSAPIVSLVRDNGPVSRWWHRSYGSRPEHNVQQPKMKVSTLEATVAENTSAWVEEQSGIMPEPEPSASAMIDQSTSVQPPGTTAKDTPNNNEGGNEETTVEQTENRDQNEPADTQSPTQTNNQVTAPDPSLFRGLMNRLRGILRVGGRRGHGMIQLGDSSDHGQTGNAVQKDP